MQTKQCPFCYGAGSIKFGKPLPSGNYHWRKIACDHTRDPLYDLHRNAA